MQSKYTVGTSPALSTLKCHHTSTYHIKRRHLRLPNPGPKSPIQNPHLPSPPLTARCLEVRRRGHDIGPVLAGLRVLVRRVQVVHADAVDLVSVGQVARGRCDAEIVAGGQDDPRSGETFTPGTAVVDVSVNCRKSEGLM